MNRKIAPELNQINKIDLILPKKIDLGNNIDLFWINGIPDNTIKLDFIWNAGSKHQEKPLISQFCNHLIFSGSNDLPSNEIAEKIDELGGYLSHLQNKDHAGFTVFGLVDSILPIFDIIQTTFKLGFFPENELKKWSDIKKKEFELNEEKVSINARKLFTKNLFGNKHPYGKLATLSDFDNVKQKDLQHFFQKHYMGKKPTLFLVGNAPISLIENLEHFAKHFEEEENNTLKNRPNQTPGKTYLKKEGSVQTAIRIGKLLIHKKHPDFIPFQVLNTAFGGYFGSRLMKNIREDKGYTYGIGSGISVLEDSTFFFISTEVAVEKREATLKEIYFEMERLKTELIPDDELSVVKNYMLGSFLRNSDGAIAMMEKYKNCHLQNLEKNYYSNYLNAINKITSKRIQEVANQYFSFDDLTEVSFG